MFPHVVIFGRDIWLYSVMVLCGLFAAGSHACVAANKRKYDYTDLLAFVLLAFIGVFVGSRLLYALVNYKEVIYVVENISKIDTFEELQYAATITLGGSVFYGGLIGGLASGWLLVKRNRKYEIFVDIVAVNIPLFHFFGRIGCFLGGCCFGIPSKPGFRYTVSPILEANGVERFPVQLLEALFNLVLFLLLNHFHKKNAFRDKLLFIYLMTYAAGRFFLEFLRGDTYRGIWLFLSTSQIISVALFLFALVTLIRRRCSRALAAERL